MKDESRCVCVCVKPEFIDGHVCYKLRNSLGRFGGIRVIRVSDDLGGSSSRGRGGVVAKSEVVHSCWCVKNPSEFRWVLMAVVCSSRQPSVGRSTAFEDFRCLSSYPLDQVGSGKFLRGKIYDWLKKGILLMWINFLHSRSEALRGASCAKTHFIHYLGGSCQANFRSNATLLQPRVYVFEWNRKSGEIWILLFNIRYSPFLFDELYKQNLLFSSLPIWAFMSPPMISGGKVKI